MIIGCDNRKFIPATDLDVVRANSINKLLFSPVAILPSQPGDPIRPLSASSFSALKALRRPGVGDKELRTAIAAYIYSAQYYLALANSKAMWFDLDGRSSGPVSLYRRRIARECYLSYLQSSMSNQV